MKVRERVIRTLTDPTEMQRRYPTTMSIASITGVVDESTPDDEIAVQVSFSSDRIGDQTYLIDGSELEWFEVADEDDAAQMLVQYACLDIEEWIQTTPPPS